MSTIMASASKRRRIVWWVLLVASPLLVWGLWRGAAWGKARYTERKVERNQCMAGSLVR